MSGIYIHGVSMPKDGLVRNISIFDDGNVRFYGGSTVIGKTIELQPHGDLIDRNHLEVVSYHNSEGMEDTFDNGVKWMLEYIDKLTPVIPEDEEETP